MAEAFCRILLDIADKDAIQRVNNNYWDVHVRPMLMEHKEDFAYGAPGESGFTLFKEAIVELLCSVIARCYSITDDNIEALARFLGEKIIWSKKINLNKFFKEHHLKAKDIVEMVQDALINEKIRQTVEEGVNKELELGKIDANVERFVPIGKKSVLLGNKTVLISYFLRLFLKDMRTVCIFDKKSGLVPRDSINFKIAEYKNAKYKLLRKYLLQNEKYKEAIEETPEVLYGKDDKVKSGWRDLLLIAEKVFFGDDFAKTPEQGELSDEDYNKKLLEWELEKLNRIENFADQLVLDFKVRRIKEHGDRLEAYLAFVLFNPKVFDDSLKSLFGDTIDILENYPSETDIKNGKYTIKDVAHYSTGWSNDEENKEALNQVGKILEILINGTPIISIRSGKELPGRFLSKQAFIKFWELVKNLAYEQGDTTVINAFINFRDDPLKNMRIICELVAENSKTSVYHNSLRSIARTINLEFLSSEVTILKDGTIQSSLYGATLLDLVPTSKSYFLIHAISGMVDRTSEASYQFYGEDENGDIASLLISSSSAGRERGILVGKFNSNINRDQSDIIKNRNVEIINDGYGNVSFTIKLADDKKYTFTFTGKNKSLSVKLGKDDIVLSDIFSSEINSEDIYLYVTSDYDLEAVGATSKKNAIIILDLIDLVLGTRFVHGDGDVFSYFCEAYDPTSSIEGIRNLLGLLNDALSGLAIKKEWLDQTEESDFGTFITNGKYFESIKSEDLRNYYDPIELRVLISRENSSLFTNLINAMLLANGDYYRSVVAGVDGNNIAKVKKLTLAQSLDNIVPKLAKMPIYALSILSLNRDVRKGCYIFQGMKVKGEHKVAKDLVPGEWFHSSFMYDYLNSVYVDGTYICMPVVYSDKTTFYKYRIALQFSVGINGDRFGIDLLLSSIEDLIKGVFFNKSQFYGENYREVNRNTAKILEQIVKSLADAIAEDAIHFDKESYLPKSEIGKRVKLLLNDKAVSTNIRERISSIWYTLTLTTDLEYENFETLRELMWLTERNTFDRYAFNLGIPDTINLYYQPNKIGNTKVIDCNLSLHFMANVMYNALDKDSEPSELFMKWFNDQRKRGIQYLLKYGNWFNLLEENGEARGDSRIIREAFKKLGIRPEDWINNNRFVFAKVVYTDSFDIQRTALLLDYSLLELLDRADHIEYNPLLDRYLATDMLTSFDLKNALVGNEFLHPNKGSDLNSRNKLYSEYYDGVYFLSENYNESVEALNSDLGVVLDDIVVRPDGTISVSLADGIGDVSDLAASEILNQIFGKVDLLNIVEPILGTFSYVTKTGKEVTTVYIATRDADGYIHVKKDINQPTAHINNKWLKAHGFTAESVLKHSAKDYNDVITVDPLTDVILDVNLEDLSSAKRTVNIGATINLYLRGTIKSIGLSLRRAVFVDITAPVFGPNGKDKPIDAHDGGSQGHPLEMRLRKLSLQNELTKGTIIKSIEIDYTSSGAQVLLKYALHGITDLQIRESLGSEMLLENLIRRTSSIRFHKRVNGKWVYHSKDWLDAMPPEVGDYQLDLTKDYLGNTIELRQINKEAFYYDPEKNTYYRLVKFEKVLGDDPTAYTISLAECDEFGDDKPVPLFHKLIRVNTIYDLWLAFGGCYSMSKGPKKLEYSETAWDIVAVYVNSVGKYYGEYDDIGNPVEMPSLYNTWLPLKYKFIGAMDVLSGVKNGAFAINPVTKYEAVERDYKRDLDGNIIKDESGKGILESDEEYEERLENDLSYMVLDTTFSGELLDATHIVLDGGIDVTQPTLVMAALENGGYSHGIVKSIYLALGEQVINERKELIGSIEAIIKEALENSEENVDILTLDMSKLKSQIYEIIVEIGIRAAKGDDFGTLKASIERVKEVILKHNADHKDDEVHLPLSDSSLFLKLIADYTSSINKKAIKHRSAGFAAVISPSYKMMLLYRIPKINKDGNVIITSYNYAEIELLAIKYYEDKPEKDLPIKERVKRYLNVLSNNLPELPLSSIRPGQNVFIIDESGERVSVTIKDKVYTTINTEDWDFYKAVKDLAFEHPEYKFKIDTSKPSDLLPMEVYWSDGKVGHNFYDIDIIRKVFDIRDRAARKELTLTDRLNQILDEYVQSVLNIIYTREYIPVTVYEKGAATKEEQLSDKINYDTLSLEDLKFIFDFGLPKTIACRLLKKVEKLQVNDAELILPNQYAERFGMTYNTSLNEVLSQREAYFSREYAKKHIVDYDTHHNICLTRASGKHTYIALQSSHIARRYFLQDSDISNYTKIGNKYVRIDENGDQLYVAGTFDEDNNLTINILEYIDENGLQVLVLRDASVLSELLKKNDYDDIRLNTTSDIKSVLKFKDIICEKHKVYQPLFDKLEKVEHLIYEFLVNGKSQTDFMVDIKEIDKNFENYAREFVKDVTEVKKNNRGAVRDRLLSGLENLLLSRVHSLEFKKVLDKIVESDSKSKFAAFQKSLNYVAARIPAQTQLSFMKMRVVGFVLGLCNNAYVSRYQTWLLGSDYDIDKAYLLGHEFTKSGKYLAHSPLAIINSIEGINLSEKIPIPNSEVTFIKTDDGVNIDKYLEKLVLTKDYKYIHNNINNLLLLIYILLVAKDGKITYSNKYEQLGIGPEVIKLLNAHNLYFSGKSYTFVLKVLNNVATSGIERVISSVLNYRYSHTPIVINLPRKAADESEMGRDSINMTLSNPYDRFLLTFQNMAGRDVIGIAAIAEKIFFGLSYCLNEIIRSGNEEDLKNALHWFKFKTKLLNADGSSSIITKIRHILPNINFHQFRNKKNTLKQLILKYSKNEDKLELLKSLSELFELQPDLALIISELLSAATDNAKELILEKINAGPSSAGLYLHLIIMGLDFKTISKYMTGPLVSDIINLANRQVNIFNSSTSRSRNLIKNLANSLLGKVNAYRFLNFNLIQQLALQINKDVDTKNARKVLEEYIENCIKNDILISLDPAKLFEEDPDIVAFLEYLTELLKLRRKLKRFYLDDLNRELELFINVTEGSQETTLLGQILSSNLGMRTNATELINWIENINEHVNGMSARLKGRIADKDESGKYVAVEYPECIRSKLEIETILQDAEKFGIIELFDIMKFIFGTEEYQNAAVKYYSLIQHGHNILLTILTIPYLKNTIKLFCATSIAFRTNIAAYRLTERVLLKMRLDNKFIDNDKRSIIEQYTIGTLIRKWLETSKVSPIITLKPGLRYFDVNGDLQTIQDGEDDFKIDLTTPQGIATFKYFCELYLYSALKSSTNNEKIKKNRFILELSLDNGLRDRVTRDRIDTLIVSELNMMGEFNESQQALYDEITSGLAKLLGITLKEVGIDSDNTITDILILYNLIVNKNLQGPTRMTRVIFDAINSHGLKNDVMDDWFNFVGTDLDYNETVSIIGSEEDLLEWIDNLSYYLGSTKDSTCRLKWNRHTRRYDATYKYQDENGENVYINFAVDLARSKNMSNYFVLDEPISRLRTKRFELDSIPMRLSGSIIKSLVETGVLKIAYYCE